MDRNERFSSSPWQPLTFGGVAAFARASFSRLFVVELLFGFLAAACVVWLFYRAWEPSVREAISHSPHSGTIRQGYLEWNGPTPARLSDRPFLSIIVDLAGSGELGHFADVQLELSKADLRLRSLLGYSTIPYPPGLTISLNHTELEPWWGAWHPVVAVIIGAVTILSLLFSWGFLAAVYAPVVRLIAFFADRQITLAGSWRLASASLMPGALLMSGALIAYSFNRLNLIQLLFAALFHLVLGWLFVMLSPLRLPRLEAASPTSKNPFAGPSIKVGLDS